MKNRTDTLLRQWMILKNIPVFPRKITATELTRRVRNMADWRESCHRPIRAHSVLPRKHESYTTLVDAF